MSDSLDHEAPQGGAPLPQRGSGPAWPGLALTLAGIVTVVWSCLAHWGTRLQDDAYISFLYARNFAGGHGLVYNVGEQPVEGYSNFLWTLGAGLAMKFGVEDPTALALTVGTASAALVVVLTFLLARRLGASPLLAGLAALAVGCERTLLEEAVGGLETTLFVALVVGAILGYLKEPRTRTATFGGSALMGLATLTRPEAPLYFALLELRELLSARREGKPLVAWIRDSFPRWVPFLALVLGHLAWRWSFYGELLPNTYYAKVTHSALAWNTGVDYVLQGIAFSGLFLFLLPIWSMKRMDRGAAFICLMGVVIAGYVLNVGGDFKLSFRYLAVPIVLWGALGAAAVGALDRALRATQADLPRNFGALLFLLLSSFHVINEHMFKEGEDYKDQRHEHLVGAGKLLDQMLPIDATIAVSNAGRIPYFADRKAIDMLGLNDHHIARVPVKPTAANTMVGHERGDGSYVLDQEPDAILFINSCIMPTPITNLPNWRRYLGQLAFGTSEIEIIPDYRLISDYEIKSAAIPGLTSTLEDGTETAVYLNWFQRRAGSTSR